MSWFLDFSTFDKFYNHWCDLHSWYKKGEPWNAILHRSTKDDNWYKIGTINGEFWEFIDLNGLKYYDNSREAREAQQVHEFNETNGPKGPDLPNGPKGLDQPSQPPSRPVEVTVSPSHKWQNRLYSNHIFRASPFVFRVPETKYNSHYAGMSLHFRDVDVFKTIVETGRYTELLNQYSSLENDITQRKSLNDFSLLKAQQEEIIKQICTLEWNYLRTKALKTCICIWDDLVKTYRETIVKSIDTMPNEIANIIGNYCSDLPFNPHLAPIVIG